MAHFLRQELIQMENTIIMAGIRQRVVLLYSWLYQRKMKLVRMDHLDKEARDILEEVVVDGLADQVGQTLHPHMDRPLEERFLVGKLEVVVVLPLFQALVAVKRILAMLVALIIPLYNLRVYNTNFQIQKCGMVLAISGIVVPPLANKAFLLLLVLEQKTDT